MCVWTSNYTDHKKNVFSLIQKSMYKERNGYYLQLVNLYLSTCLFVESFFNIVYAKKNIKKYQIAKRYYTSNHYIHRKSNIFKIFDHGCTSNHHTIKKDETDMWNK